MKNLNKYILLAGCCVGSFISTNVKAIIYDCDLINASCYDLGYKDAKSSCPGGYIVCPFNNAAATCDREADGDDFKFTRESSATGGWNSSSSGYDDKFVVGVEGTIYCGVSSHTTRSSSYSSHNHGTLQNMGLVATLGSRNSGTSHMCTNIWTDIANKGSHVFADTVTTESFGESIASTKIYPVHKTVYMHKHLNPIEASVITTGSVPSDQPTCESLGYVDSTDQCPGTYVKCPFNSNYVMCDMQAKAGEIKFSLQPENHNGWLLANGGTLSGAYAKSELANLLASTTLPDYRGVFLKIGKSIGDDLVPDSVPHHTHGMRASTYSTMKSSGQWNQGQKDAKWTPLNSEYSTAQTACTTGGPETAVSSGGYAGDETVPPHYIANVFIYSGKLNVDSGCMYSSTCSGTYPYSTESAALTACGTGNVTSCKACSITKYKCTQDCSSYTLTSCPYGYNCLSCGGKYKTNGCKSGYTYVKDSYSSTYSSCELDGCYTQSEVCECQCLTELDECDYSGNCGWYEQCIENCMR